MKVGGSLQGMLQTRVCMTGLASMGGSTWEERLYRISEVASKCVMCD